MVRDEVRKMGLRTNASQLEGKVNGKEWEQQIKGQWKVEER